MSVIINSCAPGCWTCYPSKEHSKSCFLNWKPHDIESSFGVWKILQMISSHAFHRTHTPWKPRIITGRSESELYITGTSNIMGWWYLHSNIICCTPDSCTMDLHNQHPQIYQLFDQELLSPKTQAHHFEGPKISKLLCFTLCPLSAENYRLSARKNAEKNVVFQRVSEVQGTLPQLLDIAY